MIIAVDTFNPSRYTNDNDGYPRTLEAMVVLSNTSISFSEINSDAVKPSYSKGVSFWDGGSSGGFLGSSWNGVDKNMKVNEARVFKYTFETTAPSFRCEFVVAPRVDGTGDMFHLGQVRFELPGQEIPERNNLDEIEFKTMMSGSGRVERRNTVYPGRMLFSPKTSWGEKWKKT